MADFNAEIRTERAEDEAYVSGHVSLGHRNKASKNLVAFCMEEKLMVTNTLCRQYPGRRYMGHYLRVRPIIR